MLISSFNCFLSLPPNCSTVFTTQSPYNLGKFYLKHPFCIHLIPSQSALLAFRHSLPPPLLLSLNIPPSCTSFPVHCSLRELYEPISPWTTPNHSILSLLMIWTTRNTMVCRCVMIESSAVHLNPPPPPPPPLVLPLPLSPSLLYLVQSSFPGKFMDNSQAQHLIEPNHDQHPLNDGIGLDYEEYHGMQICKAQPFI